MTMFLSVEELRAIGFSSIGRNVQVSRKSSFYNISGSIGNNVRLDDFCVIKGHVEIGDHVHICGFCSISGMHGKVILSDFSTLANRVSIYTGSDDYRADALSSSTVPEEFLVIIKGDVILGRAALVGAHSVILPSVQLGEAASVGALCLVYQSIPPGAIAINSSSGIQIKGYRNVARIMKMAEEVLAKSAWDGCE